MDESKEAATEKEAKKAVESNVLCVSRFLKKLCV